MNGTHQVLAYVDDVNLIGADMTTIERNVNLLIISDKDIGLAVKAEKTKSIELGRHRGMMVNVHTKN